MNDNDHTELKEARDLLDAVLADRFEGDDWVAIERAHDIIEQLSEE